ncbi:MAG: exodeoxyribonuclease VII large subunit [Lachnospiraceae bacterium]|jgi:exodeoxyribonuclease VII large subunit|nr:exodeoxyribonuclease VII large subunit [Lachnospiraceae bacterium]
MMKNVYSVSQVNRYIKNMFSQDFLLNKLYVKGEISNCKYHTSGHIYFTLKDASGTINVIMFAGNARSLKFKMKEGQNVIVLGNVDVYEKSGQYQLYAKEVVLDGEGVLYQKFHQLKQELLEMGMFDACYKKKIPAYVKRVGIVTASTGAAIQDIINIAHRRNPYVQLYLYPALVQGEGAVASIVNGISEIQSVHPDVIIVGRGGGSIEDLWAFNEEEVAYAIFHCPIPIISAVGHETDTTIADYVADLRAPTPSAAAELAVFDLQQYIEQLRQYENALTLCMRRQLSEKQKRMLAMKLQIEKLSPMSQLQQKRQQAMDYEDALMLGMKERLEAYRHKVSLLANTLDGLSPLKKLGEGFSYVESMDGRAISSLSQVQKGQMVRIHVTDGDIEAEVKEKIERITDGEEH